MKILVTGGAGFIGAHLVNRLATANASEIIVLDNLHRGYSRHLLPAGVRFLKHDVRDRAALADAMAGCGTVFHLAAQSNVLGAVADAEYAFSSNVVGTHNLLTEAKRSGVRRVVFTSSREVYGDPKTLPVRESTPLKPKNAYGASKLAGEVYCRFAATQGLETCILRLANVYGPADRDRVIPLFLAGAIAGKPLTVYGRNKVLDFVWIDTVVEALIRAATGPVFQGAINVGSGLPCTIADLAHRIVELTGSTSSVHVQEERGQEVGRFVADIRRGRRLLDIPAVEDPLWGLPQMLDQ